MQRRESAQRVPRFCRGSAGELRQPRLSVRGVATLAMILPPPLVRLIPPAANWPGGCPRLSTSGPAAPRAWVCVSGGFLELYRPDSPLDSRREDLAALILELAFSLAPTHSMSMRSPPSVGDPRVCDLKFGLKDCVNLCPHATHGSRGLMDPGTPRLASFLTSYIRQILLCAAPLPAASSACCYTLRSSTPQDAERRVRGIAAP